MALGNKRPSGGQREQRPNSGWLKENDRPQNSNSPHYRGVANVDGRDYWVSLWDKGKGLSLSFQRKDEERRGAYETGREAQAPQERRFGSRSSQPAEYDDRPPVESYDEFDR